MLRWKHSFHFAYPRMKFGSFWAEAARRLKRAPRVDPKLRAEVEALMREWQERSTRLGAIMEREEPFVAGPGNTATFQGPDCPKCGVRMVCRGPLPDNQDVSRFQRVGCEMVVRAPSPRLGLRSTRPRPRLPAPLPECRFCEFPSLWKRAEARNSRGRLSGSRPIGLARTYPDRRHRHNDQTQSRSQERRPVRAG